MGQAGMLFQLAQRDHGADRKLPGVLLDGIQSQPAQVDGGAHGVACHLQPKHTAQHTGVPLLVQLPCLFQAFRLHIVLNVDHFFIPLPAPF